MRPAACRWISLLLASLHCASCSENPAGPLVIDSVAVSPAELTVLVGDTIRLTAVVTGSQPDHRVRWRTSHGTIDSTGLYTAPANPLLDTVLATSRADPTKIGHARVVVVTGIDALSIAPNSPILLVGDTLRFSVTVTGLNGNRAVRWSAVRGTIDSLGRYVAPTRPAVDTVRAVSVVDSSKAAAASVTVAYSVLRWVRFRDWGGTRSDDANAVGIDVNGNIVVAGIKWLSNSGNPVPDSYAAFASFDSAGSERWSLELPTPSTVFAPIAVSQSGGDLYFTGANSPTAPSGTLCGAVSSTGSISLDPFANALAGTGGLGLRLLGGSLYVITGNRAIRMTTSCAPVDTITLRESAAGVVSLWVTPDHLVVGGMFNDTAGHWDKAGFVRLLDLQGRVLWERVYDDCLSGYVAEDIAGIIYFACRQQQVGGPFPLSIAALDRSGTQLWRRFWDGGDWKSGAPTGLILNPRGGVVLVAALAEPEGANPYTPPLCGDCYDFGLWAVGPSGATLWTVRQDFNDSYWDYPRDAAFIRAGELVVVGHSIPHPSADYQTQDLDWVIARFRVP